MAVLFYLRWEIGFSMTKIQKLLLILALSGTVGILAIAGALIYSIINNSHEHPVSVTTHKLPSGYPSPNRTKEAFDTILNVGNVAYRVSEGSSHWDASQNPIDAGFYVTYYNTLKRPQDVPRTKPLNIGCIAANNQSFKQKPGIFHTGAADSTSESHTISLTPLGQTTVALKVNGDCQFIGTEDGSYWWTMPTFGE